MNDKATTRTIVAAWLASVMLGIIAWAVIIWGVIECVKWVTR